MRAPQTWRLAFARSGGTALVSVAVVVGAGAGLGAVAFRYLIQGVTELLRGHADGSDVGHAANHLFPFLGGGVVVLAPIVAGLVYGPLVQRFAPQARGHGVPEVMYAVSEKGGRIPARVAAVKALASALTIGSGGSVGREGPIVQIGSALGSSIGQALRVPSSRLRTLVACGAAGGIAATFNAPLAGVFFSLELILGDFAAEAFGAVVVSSVVASVIARSFLGDAAFLDLPAFHVHALPEYALYVLLGLVGAVVARVFTRVLYLVEDGSDAVWARTRLPEWARPALGGLLLGLVLLALPEMYGVGYPVLTSTVAGHYAVPFLLVLVVGKVVATSLTIGIGGSGGVFAPSLFMGAATGEAFGLVAHDLAPGLVTQPGAYALLGMGAVFAGAARAPITAVLILFELTGEYTIILPLMLAVVTATAASRLLSEDTIYTLKLRRRGVVLRKAGGPFDRSVSAVMTPAPEPLQSSVSRDEVLARLRLSGGCLPVLDGSTYLGIVSLEELEEDENGLTAGDLAVLPATLGPDDPLHNALVELARATGGVPVVEADGLVGWVTHRSVVAALAPSPAGAVPAG